MALRREKWRKDSGIVVYANITLFKNFFETFSTSQLFTVFRYFIAYIVQ
jgi:hypothetical protein